MMMFREEEVDLGLPGDAGDGRMRHSVCVPLALVKRDHETACGVRRAHRAADVAHEPHGIRLHCASGRRAREQSAKWSAPATQHA